MHGLEPLSPILSEFSDSFSNSEDTQPTQLNCDDSVANTYITEHPDSFEMPLFTPLPQEEVIGCFECHDLHFRIIYAWTTTHTVSLSLHNAALRHFCNHSDAISIDIEFRELAKFMERAGRQVNERMYGQEFLPRPRGMLFEFDAVQANAHHAIDHYDTRAAVVGAYTEDAKPRRISKLTISADAPSNQSQSSKQRFC
jgi:hypothetical protein